MKCGNEGKKNKEICEDVAQDNNSAIRKFESYLNGNEIKLG